MIARRGALLVLAEALSDRDRAVLETVAELRLVSGEQLRRLFFYEAATGATGARLSRRALARLAEQGLLRRLERRVGGVRAGSAGYVYGLGATGRRLAAQWRGETRPSSRGAHEPGLLFARHTLAISELFVRLVEAERTSGLELAGFAAEPACWRSFLASSGARSMLKPDALVRLAVGKHEESSFVEVDLGTAGRGALLRKCRAYLAYYHSGAEQIREGVFPRVVWITTTPQRVRLLGDVVQTLPSARPQLFTIVTEADALRALVGEAGQLL